MQWIMLTLGIIMIIIGAYFGFRQRELPKAERNPSKWLIYVFCGCAIVLMQVAKYVK